MICRISRILTLTPCCNQPPSYTQILFTHYLERHRNLQYLEAQLDGYHRAEAEAMEVEAKRLRKMQRRLA